ncbi:alpha/beta hydrolase-fold protein [Lutimonas sp.]|uniref:alpha/beta hydrolase-fold protein n=1 Tax=Lutimonas sp. TaxID=1872403 RepID=UPI003D9AB9AD
MKNLLFLLITFFLLTGCQEKNKVSENNDADNLLVFGKIDSIQSEVLNESRKIWIHVPGDGDQNIFSGKKYPVLYLLDGPGHFYSVAGMMKQLSTANGNALIPEMVIVAIPNTNRTRDLTPTHSDISPFGGDTAWLKDSGGGEAFTDFLEKELIPYIDQNYPVTSYRTYVGHSFGGLAVINTLMTRPDLFDNYISIDPSMWWNNQETLQMTKEKLSEVDFSDRSLFVGVANTLPEGMDVDMARKDTSSDTYHYRSIMEFVDAASAEEVNGLAMNWKYYSEDDHGSVPLITEYDAFREMFSWYRFEEIQKFYDPSYQMEPAEMRGIIESHYEKISDRFGYSVLPDEMFVNSLGYGFMNDGKLALSEAAFDLNIQNYPESFNVYDSKGDYYMAAKDSLKALELFQKAVEISPNEFSQEKIDMLQSNMN